MKIAYIVLCHKNPEQVNNLVSELISGNADVYIHFDKKVSFMTAGLKVGKRVKVLSPDDSLSVKWGTNSIVKSTLRLIQEVKASGKKYDYIWLLSGQDYPILSQNKIECFLKEQKGKNFIEIIDKKSSKHKHSLKLCEVYYPSWATNNNFFAKCLKRIYMVLSGGFSNTISCFKRKKPFDFSFYFGSQWWCLRADIVFAMLEYCDNHPEFLAYFDNVIVPDECFFQTLFMGLFPKEKYADKLVFVNWGNDRRSPDIITEDKIGLLRQMSGKYCFARKFDKNVDSDVMLEIKEELLCR